VIVFLSTAIFHLAHSILSAPSIIMCTSVLNLTFLRQLSATSLSLIHRSYRSTLIHLAFDHLYHSLRSILALAYHHTSKTDPLSSTSPLGCSHHIVRSPIPEHNILLPLDKRISKVVVLGLRKPPKRHFWKNHFPMFF
jgi:hypothetical protein